MRGTVNVEVEVDPQDVYDDLTTDEQRRFLQYNIGDLQDANLIKELADRGYNMEGI